MSKFLTPLLTEFLDDVQAKLVEDLVYESDVLGETVTVPKGYVTDFASVPRYPIIFWATGDTAHKAAVIHDYLYQLGKYSRKVADDVLLEAMKLTGIATWRCYSMYWAVRTFGASHYGTQQPEST